MDVVWWMVSMTVGTAGGWLWRKSAARAEVSRWVGRGGLPAEPDLVAAAQTWFERRQTSVAIGVWVGMMLGGVLLLVTGAGLNPAVLTWWFAAVLLGGGIATCARSYLAVRNARADEPRAAALRPRRLVDYLSAFEIWLQYGLLAVPLLAAVLGLFALHSGGWTLVAGGLVAVPMAAAAFYLQRLSLLLRQSATDAAGLQWQEAFRAVTLRDLGLAGMTISWLLGAAAALSFEWPDDVPGFVQPATYVLFLGSTLLIVASLVVSVSRRGLRRVLA
ncbi:hypothetical protein [Kribbella sp. CA-247076]|uniref:hypothetical protein n=1 Tax=Kribbella sp. CA-247076 TaxID=3239941 RepID=UPI003D941630